MNELVNSTGSGPLTMSSREIADLLEARHDSVKRTVERLADRGVIQLPPLVGVKNHLGQTVEEYRIAKRDSYVVVAQLSPEFTARLVDRWQYLEARASGLPDFNDPIAAARAWIDASERARDATQALRVAAPKVEAYDFFIGSRQENINLQRAMKMVSQSPNIAIRALRNRGVLFGTPATPKQYYCDQKYFVMLPVEDKNDHGKVRTQTFVTPKGLDWLRKSLPDMMQGGNA